jgi:hypothetical protein
LKNVISLVSAASSASPSPRPSIFSNYSFCVHHPLTGMTGSSLHMQWPVTSQSHGSIPKENNEKCETINGQNLLLLYICTYVAQHTICKGSN